MKKLNPIERSQYISNQYKTYLESSFRFGNDDLQDVFEQKLKEEELFKGPYVALTLPFKRGLSIQDLVAQGTLCKSFLHLKNIDFTRPLYSHQEEAIRLIGKGRSAVITTGTGSGKTECFLYPILNSILSDLENGNHEVGIRAIFLYPMNPLVNDQVDRIRKILTGCPEITYGFFTGDTEDTVPQNYRDTYGKEVGAVIPENELVSREEIRKSPPHLLFTNYSMLEYLMIRPNDYALFSSDRLNNWKYIVLDEAHTYYGSKGIEVSMLMRRVTGLTDKKPQFILTSATLGEKGKSEEEIVEFAQNLTAVHFEQSDIIFSKRIPLTTKPEYTVSGPDYMEMLAHHEDAVIMKTVYEKYSSSFESDISASLYKLLCHDTHVHHIYELLESNAKTFSFILKRIPDLTETELIALIDLINFAEKNGVSLFDLKYHSFVRPLSGAYITLGTLSELSLTKTNYIGDLKAFEIGNCRYCNAPYIIGKIQHNQEEQLDYLFQNEEVDIYENYGENEFINLDYFLINSVNPQETLNEELVDKYVLCSKCGSIYPADNLNANKCECDSSFKKIVYRVRQYGKKGDLQGTNNVHQCPCCMHKSAAGVVKTLNLGKDEGTAIVAQTLYEAIDDDIESTHKSVKLSLKSKSKSEKNNSDLQNVKQFLSFSDSRQQASFAAVFMDETYARILRKRLIWKVFENNFYNDISVDELAAYLTDIIKQNGLFSEVMTPHKNAWVTLLADLLKIDGAYDGEGLGLYYFDIDLSQVMDQIDEEDVKEEFGKYNIDKKDLETIMQVVLGVFKTTPAINYTKSTLTPEEKMDYLGYRRFDNSIIFRSPKSLNGIRSFLPVKGEDNLIVRYVEKACGCSAYDAEIILDVIFNNLAVEGGILSKHESRDVFQIDASKYIVKSYKNHKYYLCEKCGNLTPYNVHNVCTQDYCEGRLIEVDPDFVLKDNYYRNQYKTKKIENIVIKEHTAQLDRKKAKQYQKDFKDQKINILSCSTTFELGVDIGELDTVFMRNVPPTPANYVQRAGRAGRRKGSSAYVLTYCGVGSHDYTYFQSPEEMISGKIEPPHFNILNNKIISRHLLACCLGFFFRKYPDYFKSMESFVFNDGVDVFYKYINSKPDDLSYYINNRVLPEQDFLEFHDFQWLEEMGEDSKLNNFIEEMRQTEKELVGAQEAAVRIQDYSEAAYYQNLLKRLYKGNLLDELSKYCVIPKYGFPVDVVDLKIYDETGKPANSNVYENTGLNRDMKIAISEYAPDSEVIVDKKKYTSKYITLPNTSPFPKHYFCECPRCKKINVYLSRAASKTCKYCGDPIGMEEAQFYIEPVYGFKTGETKESKRMKPKRSYSGEVSYIGGGIIDQNKLEIGQSIFLESSSEAELLIVNKFDFYMCPICGYSDIEKKKTGLPIKLAEHKNFRQYNCQNEALERIKLGHSFKTDVIRIIIPELINVDRSSFPKALSFLYAFLEGVSRALEIERNDISGLLEQNLEQGSYDVILYDDVPGGAGHVKRLMDKRALVKSLEAALEKVSQNCCDENTSCYNCLRNYYNQSYHSLLRRIYAKEIIEDLLSNMF